MLAMIHHHCPRYSANTRHSQVRREHLACLHVCMCICACVQVANPRRDTEPINLPHKKKKKKPWERKGTKARPERTNSAGLLTACMR